MSVTLDEISMLWPMVDDILALPRSETQYGRLVSFLDEVVDVVGEDESHPLASLMETLGTLVETYEARNVQEIEGDPAEALRTLMAEHDLKQSDLQEVGSQGVVSEILSGKRKLNVRQIEALAKRFKVSPGVFI